MPARGDGSLALRIANQDPNPVAIIVHYIAEQPFQAHYRRKPWGSLQRGWGARLSAYFWPKPDQNWPTTCSRIGYISSRIEQAIEKLKSCADDAAAADDLLDAFKCTCDWGSVKLPELDPRRLAAEVLEAERALSRGRQPPSRCRLNSAWTKLYAFALRDTSWKWPSGYGKWASQMAANLLCRKVAEELNTYSIARPDYSKSGDCTPWTLREIEAVLFMEGY